MNWCDVFPVLSDEQIHEYCTGASEAEARLIESWFEVRQIINPRNISHVISVSLFWKNLYESDDELVILGREMFMNAGRDMGVGLRYDPWKHYVAPLIKGAKSISNRDDIGFRVYLASDLEFLIPDLVDAGCEIFLMLTPSIRHNPGAMWRFLAFEERNRVITILDADMAGYPDRYISRTESLIKTDLSFWRMPVRAELNGKGFLNYRPIAACQMGGRMSIPVRQWMYSLIWQAQRNGIGTWATPPASQPVPIAGTKWPDYGFDEWFLLSALYPRITPYGILTVLPIWAKSRFLLLDIEYCTWANSQSAIAYYTTGGRQFFE